MKWVTRERPKVDRIACPWLIKRFVDPAAEFLYVSVDQIGATAECRLHVRPQNLADELPNRAVAQGDDFQPTGAAEVVGEQFVEDLCKKVHKLDTDTLKIALTNTAPNAATHKVFADVTEIGAGNGRMLSALDVHHLSSDRE